ncbi:uncharacterized protein EAE98_002639 [Botrytis deweyae]|uniref:RING-type domain-containing protein n=1 Tax=Botrytis deweyae TaxID=2478750 RepID=A0ABQ7IXR5_9HELO|nr:uncharacterized protein EAE98_002639 [Botrytis deweyae]KAF7936420.1 hypothetical protein EAE98_002639 [Botrytis deweyae]
MSSGQSNISATEEVERSGQQNTSGNAGSLLLESLALHENILQDEAPADATSYDTPEDTESSDPANNEELSGGLTDDDSSDTSLQNVVPQEAAAEDVESINAEIWSRFNRYIRTRFPNTRMNNQHVVGALVIFRQQLNDRNGSGTTPASTIDFQDGIPVQTISIEIIDDFHGLYAGIRPRESHADIEENHRNQAIDELLTPVFIDETQTESVLCPICNEKYDSSTENGASHGACMVPGCKHVFGRECINIWLKEERKSTCPMCRGKLDIPTNSSNVYDY